MSRVLQRTIHAACREIGIDADTRHELQLVATGKASMKDMDEADLRAVLDALKTRGWSPQASKRRPAAPRRDLRLIHVLWGKLAAAGKLSRPDRAGLNAFIRARFGNAWGSVPADVDMLREWGQIDAVLQALWTWCDREGVAVDPVEGGRRR